MQQPINTAANISLPHDVIQRGALQHDSLVGKLHKNEDIRHLLPQASVAELEGIAQAIRGRILEVVSRNGGHLSSTLGAVELIIGMHAVFDCALHPFIYDVSHQAYAHKLLTGRFKDFESLRQINGISGFIAPYESSLDYFIAGHSSTSLSLAVGAAKARKIQGNKHKPIVMIGDGSMSAGLVYEALNELGDLKLPVVIILNDNEMSIAKPIGAISKILSKTIASPFYQSMREKIKKIVDKMPDSAAFMAKRFEESFKLITPGLLFEEFGIDYIGPIDGNNIAEVIETLKSVRRLHRPVIIHAQTIKGKGYQIAEGRYEKWHGVAPFDLTTGQPIAKSTIKSPTAVFSDTLLDMARGNERIVGVTAAMPSGTGLDKLMDCMPERFFDVAIAEQHAVTSMAAMAKEGMKPYIAIYSTFLQRAFDQIVHDVSIMNLPVVFCIDRAGIVGEDGETHQGLLDIAYLQGIPNMNLIAPRDNESLRLMLEYSQDCALPLAIRYPRGSFMLESWRTHAQTLVQQVDSHHKQALESCLQTFDDFKSYQTCLANGRAQMLFDANLSDTNRSHKDIGAQDSQQSNILLIGYGNGVGRMASVWSLLLTQHNIAASLLDLVSAKPLDVERLTECMRQYRHIFIMSDSYKNGGIGSLLMQLAFSAYENGAITQMPKIVSFEIADSFVRHGNTGKIESMLGIDSESLTEKILSVIG